MTPIQLSKSQTWDKVIHAENKSDISLIFTAIIEHVSTHTDESFETVEKRFRAHRHITHLFAQSRAERIREFPTDVGPYLERYVDPITDTEKNYCLRVLLAISERNKQKIEELQKGAAGNIERLKDAGLPRAPQPLEALALSALHGRANH